MITQSDAQGKYPIHTAEIMAKNGEAFVVEVMGKRRPGWLLAQVAEHDVSASRKTKWGPELIEKSQVRKFK